MSSSTAPQHKPTGRQMFRIAYSLLEIAGIPAPKDTREASELIDRLTAQRAAALNITREDIDNAPF